jgi:hypothetical protein
MITNDFEVIFQHLVFPNTLNYDFLNVYIFWGVSCMLETSCLIASIPIVCMEYCHNPKILMPLENGLPFEK